MELAHPSNQPGVGDEPRWALTSLWHRLAVAGVAFCLVGLTAAALGFTALLSPHRTEGGGLDLAVLKDAGRASGCGAAAVGLGMTTLWAAMQVRRSARTGADGEAGLLAAVQIFVQMLVWPMGTVILLAIFLILEFAGVLAGIL